MATLKIVPLDYLVPSNYRKGPAHVKDLVESILQYGLLQNLVAYPSDQEPGKFILLAGHRRFYALVAIKNEGKWQQIPSGVNSEGVPVLVKDTSDCGLESIVENEIRRDVAPWHTGMRFHELAEAGLSQSEVAARLGKSRSWVQYCMRMASDLSPAAIRKLDRLPLNSLTRYQLVNIASLTDSYGKPDKDKQLSRIDFFMSSGGRKKPGPIKGKESIKTILQRRYEMLTNMLVPDEWQEIVQNVLNFLSGRTAKMEWPR